MKASTTRWILNGATAVVAVLMVLQFWDYWKNKGVRLGIEDSATIRKRLRVSPEKTKELVRHWTFYEAIQSVNVTGIPPKVELPPDEKPPEQPKVQVNPLEQVLAIIGTYIDGGDPAKSQVLVRWKDSQISEKDQAKVVALTVGDWLPKPYDSKYRLDRVQIARAVFVTDEGKELYLRVPEMQGFKIGDQVPGPVGPVAQHPYGPASVRPSDYTEPAQTREVSPNSFWVSRDDATTIESKGLEMLGREVQTAPYLDPKTRRPAGLRVTLVRPDSIPSKLGVREGDVVRDLNGAPIRSTSDVYAYAKANPGVRQVVITVERFGRPVALTYVLP